MKNRETEGDSRVNPICILDNPMPDDKLDQPEPEQEQELDPKPINKMKCNSCQKVIADDENYLDCDCCTGYTCQECGNHALLMQGKIKYACTPCYNIFSNLI